MTLKKEYSAYLNENFKGLEIKMPLFYNWNLGLRFDLQKEFTNPVDTDNSEYFQEVYHRAKKLFEFCFDQESEIYLIVYNYKWRKQRIRKSNPIFKLISKKIDLELKFDKISTRYEPNEKWNRLILREKVKNINSDKLIIGLCNTDFPMLKPSISAEVYLINIDKKLIFHIYDDRGLDILATDKETLRELYNQFDYWILEYDREKIKEQLKE